MNDALLLAATRYRETALHQSTETVERHFWGEKGVLARACWKDINRTFFAGELPWTLIIWGITAHSACLALTQCSEGQPPIITMHPSTLGGTELKNPWNIPARVLGVTFAYDVILHECMHVAVHHLRGGRGGGDSSHNCPAWMAEVNRIAPLLGFTNVNAAMTKPKRVKQDDGTSKVQRVMDGNLELMDASRFPHSLRDRAWYEDKRLPWEKRASCNVQLGVTVATPASFFEELTQ